MEKYYSTQRPLGPGTFPCGKTVKALVNFERRTFVENIGRMAWGYIIFADPLTEKEERDYELVMARK